MRRTLGVEHLCTKADSLHVAELCMMGAKEGGLNVQMKPGGAGGHLLLTAISNLPGTSHVYPIPMSKRPLGSTVPGWGLNKF